MNLVHAWQRSVILFIPHNFKLFVSVTVKTIIYTYRVLYTKLLWLLALCLLARLGLFAAGIKNGAWVDYGELQLLLFALFLAMRPSVARKNNAYFISYAFYFIYFFVFSLLVYWLGSFNLPLLNIGAMITMPSIAPWMIFFTMFLLDSKGTLPQAIAAVIRGFFMVIYNYPFCLISYSFFAYLFVPFIMWIAQPVSSWLFDVQFIKNLPILFIISLIKRYIYIWVLLPMPICFIANFYVKMVHEQLNFYFRTIQKD